MYTFVDHLAIAGGRDWHRRVSRWRNGSKDPSECLRRFVRRSVFSDEPRRKKLFVQYRNALMDYDVKRDTKLEYELYGRLPAQKRGVENRTRARAVWKKHYGKAEAGFEIDHIDCNHANNDIANLRKLTKRQHRERHKTPCPGRTKKKRGLRVPSEALDRALYEEIYTRLKRNLRGRRWGAYTSGRLVQEYKARGGRYRGGQGATKGLSRWFREKWIDVCTGQPCGRRRGKRSRSRPFPYCRPTVRVSSRTPRLASHVSARERGRLCALKAGSR